MISKKIELEQLTDSHTLPANAEDIATLRIVVREHFSRDMAEILADDILKACEYFETRMSSNGTIGLGTRRP